MLFCIRLFSFVNFETVLIVTLDYLSLDFSSSCQDHCTVCCCLPGVIRSVGHRSRVNKTISALLRTALSHCKIVQMNILVIVFVILIGCLICLTEMLTMAASTKMYVTLNYLTSTLSKIQAA